MSLANYAHTLMNMIIHSMTLLTFTGFFKILVAIFGLTWCWKSFSRLS